MTAARVGPLGVLSATGNMLYRDAGGNLTEVDTAGAANGEVLTRVGGVPAWAAAGGAVRASIGTDPNSVIFQTIGALAQAAAGLRDTYPMIVFDQVTDQGALWELVMPESYAGGDLSVAVFWTSDGTAGTVEWDGQFERNEAGHVITAAAFAAVQTITDAAPGVDGTIEEAVIAFTNAQADGLAGGDPFRFLLSRDISTGGNLLADAQLLYLTVTED